MNGAPHHSYMKRRIGAVISVGMAAITISGLRAETPQEIAAEIIYARGGLERIHNIQTERMAGTIFVDDQQGTFLREVKRPGKLRMEIELNGKVAITTYNGVTGWRLDELNGTGQAQALSSVEIKSLASEADIDGPFVNVEQKGTNINVVGPEMLGESLVDKMQVTLESGEKEVYYVESTGHYILLRENTRSVAGKTTVTATFYKNFQRVEGVLFPFIIASSTKAGGHAVTLQFESIQLNGTFDDSDFEKPAKAAPQRQASETSLRPASGK
jgi:outer membrane lipoprotein-sorting protein